MSLRGLARSVGVPLAVALAGLVEGCRSGGHDDLRPGAPEEVASFAPVASAAPRRTDVLERVGDGCMIFSEFAGERTLGDAVPCPAGLDDGERIRIASRACWRESAEASRSVPVRCPGALVEASERRRSDGTP